MMKRASRPRPLILVICALALILVGLVGLLVILSLKDRDAAQPQQPSTEQTTAATTQPPAATQATTQAATVVTEETEPQIQYYTLSFAGDCTLGNRKGKVGERTFLGTVGDQYAYPFADVQDYFATDDCTFINLENPLTDGGTPATDKEFVFKGPSDYVNILTQGSVEYANVVNNHTLDYGQEGYDDTLSTLDGAGIHYAEMEGTVVFTTESGLTIGVYADIDPQDTRGIAEKIQALRDEGAEIVVASFHWGYEYYYKHNGTQKKVARAAIDAGADIVYGHHPHVLQEIEEYGGGYIFYSLGNFSFGGNPNPPDKDTAILQMQVVREIDGSVHLGELTIIPCFVSGITGMYGNDYQPCPMDPVEDEAVYQRVLKKLYGTYPVKNLVVSSREDLYPTDNTEPEEGETTDPGEEENTEATTSGETTATEPAQESTAPAGDPSGEESGGNADPGEDDAGAGDASGDADSGGASGDADSGGASGDADSEDVSGSENREEAPA